MMHVYSIYAFCLLMLPPRGIVLSQCGCHHSFMPVAFLCSPQRVLVLMCCQNCPFSLFLKTLKKTGIRFIIWSLIGQYLEICVCPWEPARTFCCHFRRLFHWLIGPKLICVDDFVFSIFFFFCLPLLAHSDHLCILRVRCMVMVRMWAGSCVGVHGFLSVV